VSKSKAVFDMASFHNSFAHSY